MVTYDLAQDVLNQIVSEFKNPEQLEETVKLAYIDDSNMRKPSSTWSFRNKFIMYMNETDDARSYDEWKEIGRYVKKGSKAFHILRPNLKNYCPICSANPELDELEPDQFYQWYNLKGYNLVRIYPKTVKGKISCQKCKNDFGSNEVIKVYSRPKFIGLPKFRKEDTAGADVPKYKPKKLPILSEVAKAWNIKIQFEESDHGEYGFYSPSKNLISLASEDPSVFFHELAHVADSRVQNGLKGGQDPIQEAVAELTSGVLCKMYGIDRTKIVHDYIQGYCKGKNKNAVEKMCLKVLSRTEKALKEIFEQKEILEKPVEMKTK